jgi:FemAB-related protein (PEP-CTERM system-associated)
LERYFLRRKPAVLSRHPAWLRILSDSLGHVPFCLEVVQDNETQGFFPLAYVQSALFGRFLVSLPYVNYGGPVADDNSVERQLIDSAIGLAEQLDVRYLEIRHETAVDHPSLIRRTDHKVHMRRDLPASVGQLWDLLSAKVRNQVRKGQKNGLTVSWGKDELLREFYSVFSQNMRDLGTPVYSRSLFRNLLRRFPDRAELCVVRAGTLPVSAALLLHGWGVTEVPSASSLRSHNHTCANMLMYWHLLERAVERGQSVFDFGRCTPQGNTYRFKKQWGASPEAAVWQYHVLKGNHLEMRPDNPRFARFVHVWQRMPVWLTRMIGPLVVRGIP